MQCEVKWGLLHGGEERYPETSTQLFCAGAQVSEVNIMASGEGKSSSSAISRDEKTAWRKTCQKPRRRPVRRKDSGTSVVQVEKRFVKFRRSARRSSSFLVLEKQLHGRVVNIWIDFPENIQPDQNPR